VIDEALIRVRDRLRRQWGIDGRLRGLVGTLADGTWHDPVDLVRDAAVSRRGLELVLEELAPWLECRADRWRARPADRDRLLAAWPEAPEQPATALTAAMAELMRGLPPDRPDLDHVRATPATAAARAVYLHRHFDLAGARVLCLGDHDLTSAALALARPDVDIDVVDVDDRLLAYVGKLAAERGWRVRPLFADLRVGLPRSLTSACDLVFTDPPYTTAGIRLFLARAVEALRDQQGRIVFCHGFGERQPTLGLRVQSVVHELRLVAEAILPAFNRYQGGQALGSASDLYVCRPTRFTTAALGRLGDPDPRIYSRGAAARESAAPALDGSVVARALDAAGPQAALFGPGWPRPGAPLARLAGARGNCAVNLHPYFGTLYPRVLLELRASQAVLVVPEPALAAAGPLADLLTSVWRFTNLVAGDPAVVLAQRHTGAGHPLGRCLAFLLTHPDATLAGAWREGLIWALAAEGETVSKNQARSAIAATPLGVRHGRSRLVELPLDALATVPEQVAKTLDLVRT
jgi:hypothetical protein